MRGGIGTRILSLESLKLLSRLDPADKNDLKTFSGSSTNIHIGRTEEEDSPLMKILRGDHREGAILPLLHLQGAWTTQEISWIRLAVGTLADGCLCDEQAETYMRPNS